MTSLANKITSSEHSCNSTCMPASPTTSDGQCACVASVVPNKWPKEATCDTLSTSKEPNQTLQNIKDTSNNGSATKEDEDQSNLKVASGASHRTDTKNSEKLPSAAKSVHEQHSRTQAHSIATTNHQPHTVDGFKGGALSSSQPQSSGPRVTDANHSGLASRYTPVRGDLANRNSVPFAVEPHGVPPPGHTLIAGTASNAGQPALAPFPKTHSHATRSNVATAVPSELTSTRGLRSKPLQRQHPTWASVHPEEVFQQPIRALTVELVALYKYINACYWHRRRMEAPGPKYNNGYDDKDGHYIVLPGEEILNRFTVQEVLGKGSFGTVIRCYDEKRHEVVALKIIRHGFNFREQAKLELDILHKLGENANLNHLVVKLLKVFDWQWHLVLVFELLSFNLYQLIKCTRYKGVCLDLVCKFAYQLLCTLHQLEQQKPQPIIHCDIKPENILLKNPNRSGIRLIDFGSSCYADRRIHRYIQSRFYRSPEVILYLDYSTAIDRWSLGCVLVELYTGVPLFNGRSEAEQLARFEAILGPPPRDMIASSRKVSKYYNLTRDGGYELKEPAPPQPSLEDILGMRTDGEGGDCAEPDAAACHAFRDLARGLLQYRPQERIGCAAALRHPFFAPLLDAKRAPPTPDGGGGPSVTA